jgi:hypothetical protein
MIMKSVTYTVIQHYHLLPSLLDFTNPSSGAQSVADESMIAWWNRIMAANVWNTSTPRFLSMSLN